MSKHLALAPPSPFGQIPGGFTLRMAVHLLLLAAAALGAPTPPPLPWAPPPLDSPDLLASLRNTSRPRLAYSTYIGWYEDGGLNESTLELQVRANASLPGIEAHGQQPGVGAGGGDGDAAAAARLGHGLA